MQNEHKQCPTNYHTNLENPLRDIGHLLRLSTKPPPAALASSNMYQYLREEADWPRSIFAYSRCELMRYGLQLVLPLTGHLRSMKKQTLVLLSDFFLLCIFIQ